MSEVICAVVVVAGIVGFLAFGINSCSVDNRYRQCLKASNNDVKACMEVLK